ncbi:TauD/TfdA family dioxygenase [Scytonema sp. NUACC26]|uniref:TauD/TfdA family dioxygenase n=1 Tax=Scytonema sp. NUACC26 TaxID=3140176 RepID=UPI0034DC77BB
MMLTNEVLVSKTNKCGLDVFEVSKFNLDRVTLKISKVIEMSEQEQYRMFEIFNKFKFVILECEPVLEPQKNLLALKKFFGSIKRHKRSDKNGIVQVTNTINILDKSAQISATNQMHPIHTDGSFDIDPPKIVAMQCEIPSTKGGLSQIVYAEFVYEYLRNNYPQYLQNLFLYPLTITRGGETATRTVFIKHEGRILMTFRADSVISINIPLEIQEAYQIIKNYIVEPKNQLIFKLEKNQIILLDNFSILHGRTAFPENEGRKLNRIWFDGISAYSHAFKLGFVS